MSEKKPSFCRGCRKKYDAGEAVKIRSCDEDGCGRHHCVHMGVRGKDGKDACGPCNLRKARKAAKKPDDKKADDKGAAAS